MAKRYELSDASWELIKDWFLQSRKWVAHAVMIAWYCMESFGSCARALRGAIFLSALGLGQRCISVFVTGATTARSTEYWSACIFD